MEVEHKDMDMAEHIVTMTFSTILLIELTTYIVVQFPSDLLLMIQYLFHQYIALEQFIWHLYGYPTTFPTQF